jgi:hypothetical protein
MKKKKKSYSFGAGYMDYDEYTLRKMNSAEKKRIMKAKKKLGLY